MVLAALLALTVPVIPAEAASTVVYTSTADFDGGIKAEIGTDHFASNAVDQPSNWIDYPNAATVGSRTFVTYQGQDAAGAASYTEYAMMYEAISDAWTGPVVVDSTVPTLNDGHGSPALVVAPSNRVLILYGAHDTDILVVRSSSPLSVSSWDARTSLTGQNTYPHPVYVGSTLYVLYRGASLPAGAWEWSTSTDEGGTWSAGTSFVDFSALGDSVYLGNVERSGTRLYFAFSRVDHTTTNRFDLFVAYLETSDGTVRCLPSFNAGAILDSTEATANCRVVSSGTDQVYSGPVHVDASGNPMTIFIRGASDATSSARSVRWTGSAWSSVSTIASTDGFLVYTDFLFTSTTAAEAYVPIHQFGGTGGPRGGGGDLNRYLWDGAAWSGGGVIFRQEDAGVGRPLGRPVVPANHGNAIRVVFSGRIFYAEPSDNSFSGDARMYAWGTGGIVRNRALPSGNPSVETNTDNPKVPSGEFILTNGLSEPFTMSDADGHTWKWNATQRVGPGTDPVLCTIRMFSGIGSVNVTSDQATECGFAGTFPVDGDFDVRIKTSTPADGSNRATSLCLTDTPQGCNTIKAISTDIDGFWYRNLIDGLLSAFTIASGVETQVGTNTNLGTVDPLWLRITRSGTTVTWYYSSDGSSWTQDEQTTSTKPALLYPFLSCVNNGATDGRCTFDDFEVFSGSLGPSSYRLVGSWESPVRMYSGEVPKNVTIVFNPNGLDPAVRQIDYVRFLSPSGRVIDAREDNVVASMVGDNSYSFAIDAGAQAAFIESDWSLEIGLMSDGDFSVSVKSVTVEMDRTALSIALDLDVWVLWLFLVLMVGGSAAISYRILGRHRKGGGI